MKLGYVIYYVSSVEETILFYEKAFSMKRKFVHESGEYGELDTGETTLSFASFTMADSNGIGFKKRDPSFQSSDMEIGLVSENVAESHHSAVASGAVEVKKPEVKPWGQTVSYVRDLNGFLIELCSPIRQ
ncbi:VOC family protein [Bacteriovorax sp. PP10]|uniref:VOC family protein n=1 Tax=Bacteriovorax antarcticus TaxID=3088717 RepID=A0ABU5VTU4_9BACT|nr:VOC family protein [Bacteriovorax sp. PP10]MEA9356467.1 VOC family protein [Bacteriovorax sp. PP10]